MSSTIRNILLVVVAIFAAYIVLGMVLKLAVGILMAIMPILVIGGGIYVLYLLFGRKALGGGRRTLP